MSPGLLARYNPPVLFGEIANENVNEADFEPPLLSHFH